MVTTRSSLLIQVQDRNNQAGWQQFFETYQPLIERAVRRAGLSGQDIDDAVQSVLLQLIKILPSFHYQRERGFFRNWLFRVATHRAIDLHRRNCSAPQEMVSDDQHFVEPSSDEAEIREFQRSLFAAAVRSLRKEFRERTWSCFELHCLEHRSAAEVSQLLNVSENAVYVNSSRVLARIRDFCVFHGEELPDEHGLQVDQ